MPPAAAPHPAKFFEVRVHDLTRKPGLTAVCASYELKHWRCNQLAAHLIKWLPEFALSHSELQSLKPSNAVELIARAAQSVYATDKYKRRGEIGEILLHVVCREVFETLPAISKYFYKDSSNNTVKGFDAVHVVITKTGLELWLGEAKFYEKVGQAIYAATEDLKAHTKRDYMRAEFATISNMIDKNWPHAAKLEKLIHGNVSLDEIFEAICIPVLLTYDSDTIARHKEVSTEFRKAFEAEVLANYEKFAAKNPVKNIRVHLFLFPAKSKHQLLAEFDARLKSCQALT